MVMRIYLTTAPKFTVGARYDEDAKMQYITSPANWNYYKQWVPEYEGRNPWGERDWRHYSYTNRRYAVANGCKFDKEAKCWYMPSDECIVDIDLALREAKRQKPNV